MHNLYSVSTNFRLRLKLELSARDVFISWTSVEREERGGRVRRKEKMPNLAKLETASELKKLLTINLFSGWLYKVQAEISGHAVVAENFRLTVTFVYPGGMCGTISHRCYFKFSRNKVKVISILFTLDKFFFLAIHIY